MNAHRTVHWTRDLHEAAIQNPAVNPDRDVETFPTTCSGCGGKLTQKIGFVEVVIKGKGTKRYHYFGCGE